MTAQFKTVLAVVTTGAAFLLISAPTQTVAGGSGSSPPPPPPLPPAPPPLPPGPPGHHGYCCGGGETINIILGGSVVVNAGASASAGASAFGLAGAGSSAGSSANSGSNSGSGGGPGNANGSGGGGGGGGYGAPGSTQYLQGLNVISGDQTRRASYEATRTRVRKVIIEASCIDDRAVPHPASQVTPDRDIDDAYDGELYRCIAGTHMQVTIADYDGRIAFDHGRTLDCAKGEALYHTQGKPAGPDAQNGAQNAAQLICRAQIPARDCNERSLLRRFGAGVKILTLLTVEKYTAYREEKSTTETSTTTSLSLDGGVGGFMN